MPYTRINGRSIYYESHGHGRTVVFLHHGFGSMQMWKDIYPRFLEAGYRTVLFDRRGYGRSEPGDDFENFYVRDTFCDENVDDFHALTEILDLRSFHIVGQCEGGVIGVMYAGRYPDRVSSLTIASTLCFSTVTMPEFNASKFPASFEDLEPDLRDKFIQWHGKDHAEPLYEMARTEGGAYGIGMFDLRPRLSSVTCPTMVLYPDRSALFEVEQAVHMYRGLPNAELAVIPRCGHNSYDQKPDEYVRHVMNFLTRVTAVSGTMELDFSMTCIAPAPAGSGS
ncbi:MAG: alpha/beta hydrolase [Desulfomonilaceae bacterium]|nr:alpha/beta hydrolase [Desulfomonilaceae bacterium]